MDNKLKILMLNKLWPLSMGSYFYRALMRRDDLDVKLCGQFSGSFIPWRGGMNVPEKYVVTPDIPLPFPMNQEAIDYGFVKSQLGDWKPDLVLNISSTCHWKDKPTDGYAVAVGVDPHVLNYDPARKASDKFFNMQKVYSKESDIYLPYAFDPTVHYEDTSVEKIYDVAMVGLEYPHRLNLADALRKKGLRVYINTGEIFDDYRKVNSQAHIVLNWSTLDDLNARAFEAPMMGIPVMNKVTDMKLHPFFMKCSARFMSNNTGGNNDSHVGYAVEAVMGVMSDLKEARSQTELLRILMKEETYDARISQILKETGLGE